ncbi:MAG: septum formation protein Maf [Ignavibacteria bacterium]|nr:septum formation protein Maf [Ignavibacteria bacterium]
MNILREVQEKRYILASKSPRRAELLKQIGLNFRSVDSNSEEFEPDFHDPVKIVKHNSLLKSRNVALNHKNEIVIGADTIVMINRKILHKPESLSSAKKYLKELSGKKHYVYTGINIINTKNGREVFDYEKTIVHFRDLKDYEIEYYVNKYKPLDKAGAYGIQDDFGCLFIRKIEGDYYNIVGMPLVKLYETIQKVL